MITIRPVNYDVNTDERIYDLRVMRTCAHLETNPPVDRQPNAMCCRLKLRSTSWRAPADDAATAAIAAAALTSVAEHTVYTVYTCYTRAYGIYTGLRVERGVWPAKLPIRLNLCIIHLNGKYIKKDAV